MQKVYHNQEIFDFLFAANYRFKKMDDIGLEELESFLNNDSYFLQAFDELCYSDDELTLKLSYRSWTLTLNLVLPLLV